MKTLPGVCLFVCAVSLYAKGAETPKPDLPSFVFSNPAGKYAVGLRVLNQYDFSRTYIAIDSLGRRTQGEIARPVQTLVWYPADGPSSTHLVFGDYIDLAVNKDNFVPTPAEIASVRTEREKLKETASSPMWASKDAPPAKGSFPLVIYAPSFSSYPFENADLCEYLASHGYVVIASPSLGAHSSGMTDDEAGIDAQAADISFLIGFAHTLPQVDLSRVAVAGFSWGGISNLFAAARDSRIKALVSLDGSARYFYKLIHDARDVKTSQISLPILFFEQELGFEQMQRYKIDTSGSTLNELKSSDLTVVHMHAMRHGDFASLFERSPDHWTGREPTEYTAAEAVVSYGWVCRYALEFLDSVLKQEPGAQAFLKNSPAQNGVPSHLLGLEHFPSQGTPATFENFRAELAKRGFSHASEAYAKFKAQDSEFKLTDSAIGDWGQDLADGKHFPEAIEVFKLGVSLYPETGYLSEGLAEAYAKSGDKPAAIAIYKKALEKDPNDEDAKKNLKELEADAPDKK